jgi:hypothetical protein
MALPIASGQLVHPKTPKLKDVDADRARAELERKISELQDIVRVIAARVP